MSNEFSVNSDKVAVKLAHKLADLQYQVSQLEVLAEDFRDQRDAVIRDRDRLQSELDAANAPKDTAQGVTQDAEI